MTTVGIYVDGPNMERGLYASGDHAVADIGDAYHHVFMRLLIAARTHGIHADPTSFGLRLAGFVSASGSEIVRATMSLAPPAAKVTTMRIGLSGQAASAGAVARASARAMA